MDNSSFRFEPVQPAIAQWWDHFNHYQSLNGGDPYVGRRLLDTAQALGCRDIRTDRLDIISSRREPRRRSILLQYLRDLLLSGTENLLRSGLADKQLKRDLEMEIAAVSNDPRIEFQYQGVRLSCRP